MTPGRSALMARIRSKDTQPELAVAAMLRGMGYRRHVRSLPGTPDFASKARKQAIFVSGCFWHLHCCQWSRRMPVQNAEFWAAKLLGNRRRDRRMHRQLRALGYRVLVVWECQLRRPEKVYNKLVTWVRG